MFFERLTREQWAEWAKSLKPGDKVIVHSWGEYVEIGFVDHVTKSGWVVLKSGKTYAQTSCFEWLRERGGSDELMRYTEKLGEKAKEQAEAREKEERERRTIRAAKNICHELSYGLNNREMTFEIAEKIIELVGGK